MSIYYDRDLAVMYARKWALGTNPKYERLYNDCTNFTSQILHEAGWPMIGSHNATDRAEKDQWWFGGSLFVKASHSWGGAHNFYEFLSNSGWAKRVESPDELVPGDLVQWTGSKDSDHVVHSTFVSGRIDSDLLLCYHSTDRLDERLSKTGFGPEKWILWKMEDYIASF